MNQAILSSPENLRIPVRPEQRSYTLHIIMIVLLWALVYVPGLASPPLLDDADSVHAEASREMLLRHDFVTLHADGVRYFDKAPLLYWLIAGCYKVMGVNETATRLPLSLLCLGLFLAVYRLGRDLYDEEAGFYAAAILATAFGPYVFTRFLIPDMVIGLWLTLSVLIFWQMLEHGPTRLHCWLLAIITALDVLTKGLIGVVFPVAIIFGYLLITGNLKFLARMRLFSSSIIFFAVATPWHVLATLQNPPAGEAKGFFWFYFINDQIYRYLDKRVPRDYDKVQLYLFWGLLLVWLLPWSVYLLQSLRQVPLPWKKFKLFTAPTERRDRAALLLAIWALAILVFFSFSTRQEYYVIPSVPALALLIGAWLSQQSRLHVTRGGRWGAAIMFTVLLVAGIIAGGLAFFAQTPPSGTDLAELLKHRPDMYALSFGHFFDLTPQAMGAFRYPLALTAIATLFGGITQFWFWRRRAVFHAVTMTTLMMVMILFAAHLALGTFNPVLGSKQIAQRISQQYRPGDTIVLDGEYTNGSTLNFYTGHPIHLLNGRINDLWYGSLFPDCPPIFENAASFTQMWHGPQRVWFVTAHPELHEELLQGARELMKSGGKVVYSNH